MPSSRKKFGRIFAQCFFFKMIFFQSVKLKKNIGIFFAIFQNQKIGKNKIKLWPSHTNCIFKKKIKGEKDTNFKIRWI